VGPGTGQLDDVIVVVVVAGHVVVVVAAVVPAAGQEERRRHRRRGEGQGDGDQDKEDVAHGGGGYVLDDHVETDRPSCRRRRGGPRPAPCQIASLW